MSRTSLLVAAVIALTWPGGHPVRGDPPAQTNAAVPAKTNSSPAVRESPPDKSVVTRHSLKVEGETLKYRATAGYMPLRDEAGKLQARIFFIAYEREGSGERAQRPLTFAFNGGPGASSIWLHLGALGPKRVLLAADGTALPTADRLVDNECTWLGFTDLVFVDPIGTGYSRAAEGVDAKPFYAVAKDVEVAATFIRLYVTQHERWLSPKYVVGESYGTTRAAGLANHLQETTGMNLSGAILISSALNFESFSFGEGNDLPCTLVLPSCTAAAWYHKKLAADLQGDLTQTLARAQDWAMTEYSAALAKGDTLPDAERHRVAGQLAAYTGLAKDFVEMSRLRIGSGRFIKELLRRESRIIGMMDSRVTSPDMELQGDYPHFDPAMFTVTGPFVATLNDYLRRDLKFQTDLPYEFLSREVNQAWKWTSGGQGYLYVADDLAAAMTRDNHFRVFAAAGLYDLTTPYLTQQYTFDHLGLDASRRSNLIFMTYPSGHQIYTDPPSLKKLKADVETFVKGQAK
jgi:carboxypeptidase C (cathepsin A)